MVSETDGETGRPAETGDGALPAPPIIQRFGGIRPMAQKLGVPVSTVQGWKERGAIPANRREEVLSAAERHGIALEPADLSEASAPADAIALTDESDGGASARAEIEAEQRASMPAEEPATAVWEERGAETPAAPDEEPPARTSFRNPEQESPSAPARAGLLPAMLAAAVVALAISASAPWWTRAIGLETRQAATLVTDADRVQGLERRIAELESRPPAPGPSDASTLVERLDALEQANAELKSALDRLAAVPPSPQADAGAPSPELAERLDSVAGDLAAVKEQMQALQRESASLAPERLSSLSDRIEENAAELRAMQGELSRLVELPKRVQELAGTIEAASGQTRSTAFVLASGQLEAALDSGQPYASELGAVRRLAAEDPELPALLARLDEHANEGIPGMAELRLRFEDMALAAAQAAQSTVEGDWMDRAWARLRSLVTVRPVGGDVTGDSPEAHLARAEARLGEGDLAGAVTELEALEGPAAEAAAPWLAGARARLAADQAIEALRERALARVLPNGSGG
jgi:hypothetical protein